MAIVVDGYVLSAPTIKAAIGPRAMIAGKFTEQEVNELVVALQKGMRVKSTDTP
jgi:preprotein translocase subunit SecD